MTYSTVWGLGMQNWGMQRHTVKCIKSKFRWKREKNLLKACKNHLCHIMLCTIATLCCFQTRALSWHQSLYICYWWLWGYLPNTNLPSSKITMNNEFWGLKIMVLVEYRCFCQFWQTVYIPSNVLLRNMNMIFISVLVEYRCSRQFWHKLYIFLLILPCWTWIWYSFPLQKYLFPLQTHRHFWYKVILLTAEISWQVSYGLLIW